jgi:putative glutamine amidotransferase
LLGANVPIPIIGLTTYNGKNKHGFPIAALGRAYIAALTKAPAVPVLIPSGITESASQFLLERLDGLLLTGGGDIATERFSGESHPCVGGVDPERDGVEISLFQAAVESGLPFLGICRGLQVVNVALGGTLYTHIRDQFSGAIIHDYDSGSQRQVLAHEVNVVKTSHLADILGPNPIKVNSLHHQGIKELAPTLRPVAHAPDGLVEAVELPNHPFGMAVQWHPECLTDQPVTRRLFQAFVDAAGREKSYVSK